MKATAFLFVILLLPVSAFALEIYVAPVLYVDETEENSRDTSRVQADLLTALHAVETGVVLQFEPLKDNTINPPVSLFDAVTVCRDEHIDYLLYGYVTRHTYTVEADLRLFDYGSRTVKQSFFGMDDPENYDRLIQDMAHKILQYAGETFKLNIVEEKIEVTRLEIPVMAGYWTAMDPGWTDVMLGTFAIGSGVTFIPTDNLWTVWGMPWYLSTGLELKYRLGVGNPKQYKAFDNTLYFMTPVRLHVDLTGRHQVFAGLGFVYFLEFFSIADKYADSATHVYNNVGLHIDFGYRFAMTPTMAIFFRNDFDFLFNKRSLSTYSPTLGLDIQVYEKEIHRKW